AAQAKSIAAHHPDDNALHLHLVRLDEDWLHGRIGRLQTHAAVLAKQLLERDVRAVHERDDHLAVVGGPPILDDYVIAVADLLVDHRVALDAQHVAVALAHEILWNRQRFAADDRFDGHAGRDIPEERQFHR